MMEKYREIRNACLLGASTFAGIALALVAFEFINLNSPNSDRMILEQRAQLQFMLASSFNYPGILIGDWAACTFLPTTFIAPSTSQVVLFDCVYVLTAAIQGALLFLLIWIIKRLLSRLRHPGSHPESS